MTPDQLRAIEAAKREMPGPNAGEQDSSGPEHSQECFGPASPAPDALVEEIAREIANEYRRKAK